ncbi:DNA internalization-related competence protein ComEC/Rec2 [Lysobacter sp. HDW10]|uniref:DNA internalization-related competence protein ComEC/Rec2 n=1 Tax=Lysobacter sp. HDW10 TaxID=2714936 RepID=UPI00197C46D8|nr:DNA internalization-related competence protein ComEC/Rec2 [Lysobacter sp. HDW10]
MASPSARMPILGPRAAAGLLAGIVFCVYFAGTLPDWLAVCFVVVGAGFWLWPARAVGLSAVFVGWGLASLHVTAMQAAWMPAAMEGKSIHVKGQVQDLPQQEEGRRSFLFRVDDTGAPQALRGRVIRLGWYAKPRQSLPVVHAGTRWSFQVKLKRPHGYRNPGSLDSERTAFTQRIVATGTIVRGSSLDAVGEGTGVNGVRDALGLSIAQSNAPATRFIRALAVGDTRGIEDDDWRVLRANGLTHLIAISGAHVAMAALVGVCFAAAVWWLCPWLGGFLPRKIAAPAAGACVAIAYTLLAGGEVPTVRTLLMMWCMTGALLLRRRFGVAQALSASAISLALIDPFNLLRPGFWLSFLGVAWLAWCLQGVKHGKVKEMLSAQMIATIGLLPLCILFFGQTSWIAPFANLVAVPLWGLVIVPLSIAGVVCAPVSAGLSQVLWSIAAWLFDCAWPLFQHMASWPGAEITLAEASPWALAFALLGAFWLLMPRGMPLRLLSTALWLPLLAPAVPRPVDSGMIVTFLDVGQGLSILVQTRHHTLLYDAGPKAQTQFGRDAKTQEGFDAGEKVVVPALAALGIRQLDMLMLSHGDADHAGGAAAVVKAMRPKQVQAPFETPIAHDAECKRGDRWRWDGIQFEVLAPAPNMPYAGNGSSCVLKVTSPHGTVLLTGDVEAEGEHGMLAENRNALRADVVSMPHHGSKTSSTFPFVRAVGARFAVASSGYRNKFKHPREQVWQRWLDAGTLALNTPASGAVRFDFSADGIEVTQERSRRTRVWDAMAGDGVNGGSGLFYGQRGSPLPPYPR